MPDTGSFISTWTNPTATPADSVLPSVVPDTIRDIKDDVYKTLNVNMQLTDGGIKRNTTGLRSTVFASPISGQLYMNTTTGVLEYYDAQNTVWRPVSYVLAGQTNLTASSGTTKLRYTMSTPSYTCNGLVMSRFIWTPAVIGDSAILKVTTDSTYATGLSNKTTIIARVTGQNPHIIAFAGQVLATELYWEIEVTAGGSVTTATNDSQLYWNLMGVSV